MWHPARTRLPVCGLCTCLLILLMSTAATAAPGTAPVVQDVAPAQAPVGARVTITGSGLAGTEQVRFGGVSAPFTVADDSQVTATVPSGAQTGPVTLDGPDGSAQADFTVTPQNVVLILTDDQRWDSLQYMPNVESLLADQGVAYTNAFDNNPLCCPARATIMTGLTSGHNGVWFNANGHIGGFTAFHDTGDDQNTVFRWLHDAGYETALIGKLLNGYSPLAGNPPISYRMPGVDEWDAFILHGSGRTGCKPGGYFATCYDANGAVEPHTSADYSTTTSGQKAVDFINGADPGRPLFLYWAPRAPHAPTTPEPRYASTCSDVPPIRPPSYNLVTTGGPAYMAALKPITARKQAVLDLHWTNDCRTLLSVDDEVADVVAALRDTGRLDTTLIMFASDNGFAFGEHRWAGKLVPYEESLRVPVIVRDDAVIPEAMRGTSDSRLITDMDYTATFADAAAVTPPYTLDGQSLLQPLSGSGDWQDERVLIEHSGGAKVPPYCGVREPGLMFAQYATGEQELYDLGNDPFELVNVAGDPAYADTLAQARADAIALCTPTPPGFSWSP
jgi:arylsulfatase A-like enzyme